MGGQKALTQAVPKLKGFKSIHKKAEVVYTDNLNGLSGKVDNFVLAGEDLISSPYVRVKVIVRGEVTAKVALSTQFASRAAVAGIEGAGGSFTRVGVPRRVKVVGGGD
jgi:ribosomal protein L15